MKYDLYCWACDFSSNRGEGILAHHYIKELSKAQKLKCLVKTPKTDYCITNGIIKQNQNLSKEKLNLSFFENYFNPIIGIFYLWVCFLKKKKICYLNFLPLWNFFLFILLPPKTHFAPITGFIFDKKVENINHFFRKFINNLLFKINVRILLIRQKSSYFSTDLLKKIVPKDSQKKIILNYLINLIEIKKRFTKKDVDLLIYNRNYIVKNNNLRNKFLNNISNLDLKIYAIGDKLDYLKIKNLGFISRNKVNALLRRTKFVINSGENPYNIFTIDAYNNHSNIIYEKKFKNKIKFFNKKKIFFLDFNNKKKINRMFKNKNLKIYNSNINNYCLIAKLKLFNFLKKIEIK